MSVRGVVFDLDDTLCMERDYVRSGFSAVAERVHELAGVPEREVFGYLWAGFESGERGRSFDKLRETYRPVASCFEVDELVELYRNHVPRIALSSEAREVLTAIRGADLKIGIISDGPLESQSAKVKALGLDSVVDVVILTDTWGRPFWKPNAKGYLTAAESLWLVNEELCYVGDNPKKDFCTPKSLGWLTVRVRHAAQERHRLEPASEHYAPDITVDSLTSAWEKIRGRSADDEAGLVEVPMSMERMQLAIDEGVSVRTIEPPPWPSYDHDQIAAVVRILESGKVNYWTGEEGRLFEKEYAAFVGSEYGVALANGTVALELALMALGVGLGDEVVVPSRTFIASASCAVMQGARPVVADVDSVSQNLTAETVAAVLTPRTKVVVAVHLAGWPCDMDPLLELARERGFFVIEDCAQAHGATYKGRSVGSMGDVGAFSFCQDKIMTTGGEGGMLVTGRREVWERAWSYKDHGKSYDAVYNREHPPGFRWLHESFGTNWRMTEMQAAIGRVQLRKLPEWLETRRRNAAVLTEGFSRLPALRVTVPPDDVGHAYYKYYVFVRPEALKSGWDRDRVMAAVNAEGIPCFSGSCSAIYLEKAFTDRDWGPPKRLPVALELGETSLMFLVHPTLSEDDMEDTVRALEKVLREGTI